MTALANDPSMLDRVARVIRARSIELNSQLQGPNEWLELAHVAIAAMREPTPAMLEAFYGGTPSEQWLGDDWKDMIDVALSGK